ncbi:hypothetical protein SAMN05216275_14113 [Streptosporangium canum]|uniref:Uncharacterized protein n=1 Tax=Streptosporangium canum TaxID=324952 RepID=A0A1I4DIA8_9ACTN|nr:hypothetical protein [Streptosporangium canum]SFK91601.1 hypothetical protein SAMN05216275_14113 [Streptosporangium canum]
MTEPERVPFLVPDHVTQLIREHLVCITEIAERTQVTKQAVSQWVDRYPEFADLIVVELGRGPLFWWPQVQALLAELGVPNRKAAEAQKKRHGRQGARS